jgi:N-acetyl-anhydromuramyl-L-alanine amidase AmpD
MTIEDKDRAYTFVRKHGYLKSRTRRRGDSHQLPTTIILHHTGGGTIAGAEITLKNKGLGYHYMIDGDGSVIEYAKPDRYMSHAYRNNHNTIGISFVGGGKYGACNQAQYVSIIELCRDIMKEYPSVKYLTGHKHVDPRGWKIDPRWSGEPENGVNWDIDYRWMDHLREKTKLELILKDHHKGEY